MTTFNILLLTNRDSANIGEQMHDAAIYSALKSVLEKLEINPDSYHIARRDVNNIFSNLKVEGQIDRLSPGARRLAMLSDLIIYAAPDLVTVGSDEDLRLLNVVSLSETFRVPLAIHGVYFSAGEDVSSRSEGLQRAMISSYVLYLSGYTDKPDDVPGSDRIKLVDITSNTPLLLSRFIYPLLPERAVEGGKDSPVGIIVSDSTSDDLGLNTFGRWEDLIGPLIDKQIPVRLLPMGSADDELVVSKIAAKLRTPLVQVLHTIDTPEEFVHGISNCRSVISGSFFAAAITASYGIPFFYFGSDQRVPALFSSLDQPDLLFMLRVGDVTENVQEILESLDEPRLGSEFSVSEPYRQLFSSFAKVVRSDLPTEIEFTETMAKSFSVGDLTDSDHRQRLSAFKQNARQRIGFRPEAR